MVININIPIEDAVTDGSLNPVTSNAVFDALALKANSADLATVATTGDYNDLSNLPAIPSAQVNSDWNATSGVAEILNKPTIPSIAGLVPDTRNLTINGTTYDLSADRSWTIAATASTLQHAVKAGEAMTKGQAVYVSSADGTNMIVSLASNVTEATSSKTMGLIIQNLALNGQGTVITEGLLAGLNTSSATAGDPVWLGTGGNLIYGLINKPAAPAHLVFIGIVTRANVSNGEIFIRVQNGFELQELHNVSITSVADNNLLQYDSATSLWKNESLSTAGIQPTLVSATNIKTVNGNSLLGSGDLVVGGGGITVGTTVISSGTTRRVLFQDGTLVQQSANFVFDASNQLVIGGHTGGAKLDVKAGGALSTDIVQRWRNSADSANLGKFTGDGAFTLGTYTNSDTQLSILTGKSIGIYVEALKAVYAVSNAAGTAYGIDTLGRSTTVGATSYGIKSIANGGGATGINHAGNFLASGVGTTNYAGYFDAVSATTNWAIYVQRGNIGLDDANNIQIGTTTGTKIGTATNQKIGFWNATPIVQPTTSVAAATLTGGGGATITDTDTFDGYTLKQIVKALRNSGLLA
jgi:hypothetical protein